MVAAGRAISSKSGLESALAVLVVYQRPWSQVHAGELLESTLGSPRQPDAPPAPRLGALLVYDNSAEGIGNPAKRSARIHYFHDNSNGGTRAAYMRGHALASRLNLHWMILLDHDTTLTTEYLSELNSRLAQPMDPAVGLLLPRVVGGGAVLSPARLSPWGTISPLESFQDLLGAANVTALASGAVIRVEAMSAVGEIPHEFWLDYLDHWLFREVQHRGYRVELMHSTLLHELSIMGRISPDPRRLRNILRAERAFTRKLGWRARSAYPAKLLLRAARTVLHDRAGALVMVRELLGPA